MTLARFVMQAMRAAGAGMLAIALLATSGLLGCQGREGAPATSVAGRERLMPTSHTVDWLARHGQVARSQAAECASCHREEDCMSCHLEFVAQPFQMHPPNFVAVHSIDARANLQACTDCHRLETFCVGCHMNANVTTLAPHMPPPRMEFHPPGWLDARHPGNHGVMARRNINDCASCHAERDCVSCHVGINPHPSEFRFECRRWLDANPRPCAQCHGDLGALRALCP
jgi:hypothetical protein